MSRQLPIEDCRCDTADSPPCSDRDLPSEPISRSARSAPDYGGSTDRDGADRGRHRTHNACGTSTTTHARALSWPATAASFYRDLYECPPVPGSRRAGCLGHDGTPVGHPVEQLVPLGGPPLIGRGALRRRGAPQQDLAGEQHTASLLSRAPYIGMTSAQQTMGGSSHVVRGGIRGDPQERGRLLSSHLLPPSRGRSLGRRR